MFEFKPVTIEDRELLDSFLKKYGSSSCQHSFPAMLAMADKYGDEFCFVDGVLFVHRSFRDHDGFRVYLAPLGDIAGGFSEKVSMVLEDARSYNARVSFETVTEDFKDLLAVRGEGNLFDVEYARDYFEYIYTAESLSEFSGKELAPKRNRVRAFRSSYADRFSIESISPSNLDEVRRFTDRWIEEKMASSEDIGLESESKAISVYLEHFEQLDFRGIAVYLDDEIAGYAAGVPVSDDTVDEVIEKGRRDVSGIYQVLCNEFAELCCGEFTYINREEDLGIPGLRRSKESYRPCRMLDKFIIREKC